MNLPANIEDISEQVLLKVPQQAPFRFIDRISQVDDDHIVGHYRFSEEETFFQGGADTVPNPILIEAMAQTSVVAFGIYLLLKDLAIDPDQYLTLFTDVQAEFFAPVKKGASVRIEGSKKIWRRRKLRSECHLYLEDGTLAAKATLTGLGVKK